METVLIASGSEKGRVYFEDFLTACQYNDITLTEDAASANALLKERNFDLCIVNTPLTDASGLELALDAVQRGCCQSMLVVGQELAENARSLAEPAGVFVVVKPVRRAMLWTTLKNMDVTYNRMLSMRAQNENLKQNLEDIRLVNRAKSILISSLKMSEAQAHRFIEKQAMECRVTKGEMARRVIKTYEE
jgi:response regulator NasT